MPTKLTVDKKTGITAYEIAEYLIDEYKMEKPNEQFKCKLMECIIKKIKTTIVIKKVVK